MTTRQMAPRTAEEIAAFGYGPSSTRQRWTGILLVLAAGLLIIGRAPFLFTEPRFWAEEGTIYFARAYSQPWYEALVQTYAGYYSLVSNVAGIMAARCVPLERAPLVTTLIALLTQLLPHVLIFFPMRCVLPRLLPRVLLSAVVLFVTLTGEVFLCTTAAQWHLAVITFLILLSFQEQGGPLWRWAYRLLLLVAGLTGVISCFFLPLFFLKALLTRRREAVVLSAILLCATLAQATAALPFLRHQEGLAKTEIRPGPADARAFARTFVEQLAVWPVLVDSRAAEVIPSHAGRTAFGVAVLGLAVALAAWSRFRSQQGFILAGYFLVGGASLFFSLGGSGGLRYAYVPSVILMAFFVWHLFLPKPALGWLGRLCCAAVIAASLAGWGSQYRGALALCMTRCCPSWRHEVALWRQSPDRPLLIWPPWDEMKWSVRLPAAPVAAIAEPNRP